MVHQLFINTYIKIETIDQSEKEKLFGMATEELTCKQEACYLVLHIVFLCNAFLLLQLFTKVTQMYSLKKKTAFYVFTLKVVLFFYHTISSDTFYYGSGWCAHCVSLARSWERIIKQQIIHLNPIENRRLDTLTFSL